MVLIIRLYYTDASAIGPGSLFGLVTFSHKIGLYDVQGPIPVVKHIMIPADMDGHIPVDLEMAMPLCAFLAPAANTAQSGVCVDLFVIINEYADLALLKYLSIESGGCLLLYSNTNEATLPQDLMAIPGSSIWECPAYYMLWNQDSPPVLQLAFQYSILVCCDDGARRSSADGNYRIKSAIFSRQVYTLKRQLRIRTLQIGVAANYAELYESAQPEVILTVLTHKVIQASLEDGVKEACALLHDWLVILTAQYNEYNKLAQFGQPDNMDDQMHFPWGMTQSFAFLCGKSSALEPFDLLRAVHPVLSSYATPDKQAYPQHSLSQAALITSGSPIFFLDAFTCLIVYYSPTADPALPFPPPQNCK
ncbi:unnamed protein product [Sphagnum jensenii]|uniref:Sec23/Sec24 trunk domain-containing protein n=1 Tax=Sphagnum jensenii TaxID=128206 RepID=A0ABP1AHE9_9BRYO